MQRIRIFLGLGVMCALFVIFATPVQAHAPANMVLVYNFEPQTLDVTVLHSVADVNTHYIARIIINKNGTFFMDRNYTSQTSTSGMSDIFTIPTEAGDVLQVIAICSIFGQITREITASETTTPGTTTPPPAIPGFPLAAIAIGLIITLSLAMLRRQHNTRRSNKSN